MATSSNPSIEAMRAEIVRRRDAKIAAAKSQADRALSALGIVADALISIDDPDFDGRDVGRKTTPTATWVADIVKSLNGSTISQPVIFERLMIERQAELADRDPTTLKGQIAMILKRMETKGELTVTKPAYASEPTEYKRRIVLRKNTDLPEEDDE